MTAIAERTEPAVTRSARRTLVSLVALYTGTSMLGAMLLFAVQPMVAKMLLPSYGGSPMVWNTAMLFFQSALLAGYGYAHWAQRRLGSRWQPPAQIGLVALPLLLIPIAVPEWGVPPESAPPALWLLLVLAVMVGAPFTVLATTSPLIQRWYSWSRLPRAQDPYFLFAASNAGSLLALVAYPVLIEVRADVATQARWWAAGYGVFALLMITCAVVARIRGVDAREGPAAQATAADAATPATADGAVEVTGDGDEAESEPERIGWRRRLRWLGLAFIPSSLMLGVTTHISTDVAAVPLLWVIPLALYLVTFIVAFAGLPRRVLLAAVYLSGGLAVVLPWVLGLSGLLPLFTTLPLDLVLLLAAGTAGHGLLAADRPSPRRLTEFYLVVSVGGALGGLFNGLLAPVVFNRVIEFPLVIALLGLFPRALGPLSETARRLGRARQWVSAGVLAGGFGLVLGSLYFSDQLTLGPFVLLLLLWAWGITATARPWFVAVAAGVVAVSLLVAQSLEPGVRERTFFGSYRVVTAKGRTTLSHGTTVHGFQLTDPAQRRVPTLYYARPGPLGDVFARPGAGAAPVAAVGLGAGTIAAYGRPGQRLDFYEIDPAVVRIARDPRHFTYLRECPCRARTVLGDGRLRLAEAPDGTYGVIILDAFSSDAVPAHLLTREAMRLYVRKLRPGGVVVFHVSNRYLDLAPMVGATARSAGFAAISAEYEPGEGGIAVASRWVAVGKSDADLKSLPKAGRWHPVRGEGPVWTDTYSSLFGILKMT